MHIATVHPGIPSIANGAFLLLQTLKYLVANHWARKQSSKVLNYKEI